MFPLSHMLKSFVRVGTLKVIDADGKTHVFVGTAPGPDVTMRLTDRSLYYYRNGVNTLAVKAFVPTSVIALSLALIPTFSRIAPFGWFIGAALGAVAYYVIARGRLPILPGDRLEARRVDEESGTA